jgi:hypothetical protein
VFCDNQDPDEREDNNNPEVEPLHEEIVRQGMKVITKICSVCIGKYPAYEKNTV